MTAVAAVPIMMTNNLETNVEDEDFVRIMIAPGPGQKIPTN